MTAILELRNISKTFPGQKALNGVHLDVRPGEVHALVGKNGSGKSTLAKVLSGFHVPDEGATAQIVGRNIHFPVDGDAKRVMHFVHQDLGLIDSLSIIDNIGLSDGYRTGRFRKIDWRHSGDRARRALAPFGLADIDVHVPISQFTASERAIIAIARGLIGWTGEAGLLVLDETTAALPPSEVAVLAKAMSQVTARGSAILYITHRLDEVFSFAERVSILRDGHLIATEATASLDHERLVSMMVGNREIERVPQPKIRDRVVLSCRGVTAEGLMDLTFSVRSGEILGFAGLLGSGRERVADVLFGAAPVQSGEITLDGNRVRGHSPSNSLRRGIGLVPSDRGRRSVFPELSTRENVTIAELSSFLRAGHISRRREAAEVAKWIAAVKLEPADPSRALRTLSGGNQQKAVLARVLRTRPRLLVLDEATQGVDVGAKRSIHNLIRRAAEDGAAVVVCTGEAEDLPALCHRVIVMRNGSVSAELEADSLTQESVLSATTQEGQDVPRLR